MVCCTSETYWLCCKKVWATQKVLLNNQLLCRRFSHKNIDSWVQHPIFPIIANISIFNALLIPTSTGFKEKYIHQGCVPLLHQAVGLPPPPTSSIGTGRNQAQAVEQNFLLLFQCRVWEYSQPIQSLPFNPSMHFPSNDSYSWMENFWNAFFTIQPFWVPLKISIGGNFEPSSHTGTARVAQFCHLLKYKCSLISLLLYSKVFFEWQVKNIGV